MPALKRVYLALSAINAALAVNTKVVLPSGTLVGSTTTIPTASATVVNQWLGIPYASSPPEMFRKPVAVPAWTGSKTVTSFSPICRQAFTTPRTGLELVFDNPTGAELPESPDCLYLNVWAPVTASASSLKAVLFWIYGGNFVTGGSSFDFYNGASFAANQDVVFVSFNYRTNVFGFSGSPAVPASETNPGLLDQRQALQWVVDNIKNFGGDPQKITIWGESAGAQSVVQLLTTPPSNAPFQGAILDSKGGSSSTSNLNVWNSLSKALGCNTQATVQLELACVQGKPAKNITATMLNNNLNFFPVVDGVTFSSTIKNAIQAKTAAKVPVLIGTNSQEALIFLTGTVGPIYDKVAAFFNAFLPRTTSLNNSIPTLTNNTSSQSIVTKLTDFVANQGLAALSQVLTDYVFTCTTRELAEYLNDPAHGYTYNVWRYYFDARFNNTQFLPGNLDGGVYHSSELPIVFGTYAASTSTQQERDLSKYMQTAWANFAKNVGGTLGPNTAAAPNAWPQFGHGVTSLGVDLEFLGSNGASNGKPTIENKADFNCLAFLANSQNSF